MTLSGGGCNTSTVFHCTHSPSMSQDNKLGELEVAQTLYRRVGIFRHCRVEYDLSKLDLRQRAMIKVESWMDVPWWTWAPSPKDGKSHDEHSCNKSARLTERWNKILLNFHALGVHVPRGAYQTMKGNGRQPAWTPWVLVAPRGIGPSETCDRCGPRKTCIEHQSQVIGQTN
jgi:hypothetical protein